MEFKTQRDIAEHIADQDGTCNGVYCRADNEPQKIDCPLCDTISCTSKNIKPRAIEWLKENTTEGDAEVYRIKESEEPQHQSDGESGEQRNLKDLSREEWRQLNKELGIEELREDVVNHPPHYTSHPSNVECIQVTRHMGFNLGNVIKYVWRADLKGKAIEDLEKAQFYLADEIQRRKKLNEDSE
jgi:hypothetical protein